MWVMGLGLCEGGRGLGRVVGVCGMKWVVKDLGLVSWARLEG